MLDFIHGSVTIGDQKIKLPFPNPITVQKIAHASHVAGINRGISATSENTLPSSNSDSAPKTTSAGDIVDSASDTTNDTSSANTNTNNNLNAATSNDAFGKMNYSLVEVLHKASPESTGIWYNGEIIDAHVSKKGEITGYDIRLEKLVQGGGPNSEASVQLVTEKFGADKVRPFMSKEKADEMR